jgi:UDP-glucuronate decarboxylase
MAAMADGTMTTAWGRIFFLYGPHEHPDRLVPAVIRAILEGRMANTSHGEQVRDYLYADDVADVFVRLLDTDFCGAINVGSGRPVTLKTIIRRVADLMGRPELIALGAIPASPTDKPLVVADTTRLQATLNWTPAWDLDRGLRASIDYWRRERAAASQEFRG